MSTSLFPGPGGGSPEGAEGWGPWALSGTERPWDAVWRRTSERGAEGSSLRLLSSGIWFACPVVGRLSLS